MHVDDVIAASLQDANGKDGMESAAPQYRR